MTLSTALAQLCAIEQSLVITSPIPARIKAVYPFPPPKQNALPDMPCWINSWTLHDTLSWGDVRVERYTITGQLFIRDADASQGISIATSFAEQFVNTWDLSGGDLAGTVMGVELRGREPTMGMLDWSNQAYPGLSILLDVDVCIPGTGLFVDEVIGALRLWTSTNLPTWQQDPATWLPTDAAPGIYWHYVTLPVTLDNDFINFEVDWQEATLAARIVAPSSIGRQLRTRDLAIMLGDAMLDGIAMPDTSWMWPTRLHALPETEPRSHSQLQVDMRFLLDETLVLAPLPGGAPAGGPLKHAVLESTPSSPPRTSNAPVVGGTFGSGTFGSGTFGNPGA